jgi:hypothetical protein
VEVEVQSHILISFTRFGITHLVFVVFIDWVIRDDSLTVSLYSSGCGEDKADIKGIVYSCAAVPIQVHRMRVLFLSPTIKRNRVTRITTLSKETNALTVFIPSAFYLIS